MKEKFEEIWYLTAGYLGGFLVIFLIFLLSLFVIFLIVGALCIILGFYGSIAGGLVWLAYKIWAAVLLL